MIGGMDARTWIGQLPVAWLVVMSVVMLDNGLRRRELRQGIGGG